MIFVQSFSTVSYTHLDVYKRQVVIVTGYFVSSAFVSAVFSVVAVVLSFWDVVDLLLQPINENDNTAASVAFNNFFMSFPFIYTLLVPVDQGSMLVYS